MLKVEFWVDGLDVKFLKSFDRSKDSYVSVLLLIIDIFNNKSNVSLNVMIGANVFTDL